MQRFVMNSICQKTDLYASYLHLYLKGRKKIPSTIGILATWIVVLMMMSYTGYKGTILLEKSNFKTQMATILRPVNYSSPERRAMNEFGFDFAFRTQDPIEPEFGLLAVRKTVREKIFNEALNQSVVVESNKILDVEDCNADNFNHTDKEELEAKAVYRYFCIKNKSELAVGGTFRSNVYEYLEIILEPCRNSTNSNVTCQPKEIQDNLFAKQWLAISFINYYFDKDDSARPIKSYIDESIYFTILPDYKLKTDIFMKISEAKISDSLLPWSTPNLEKFVQIDRINNHISTSQFQAEKPFLAQIMLREDFWTNIYMKDTYSFTDFASDVGGIFNTVYGCGKLLVFVFVDSILLSWLIEELYRFKNPKLHQAQVRPGTMLNDSQPSKVRNERGQEYQDSSKFVFNGYDFIRRFCKCYQCRKISLQNGKLDPKMRKQYLFNKGMKKMKNEFDALAFVKMLREFQLIKQILFKRKRYANIETNQCIILHSEASEEEGLQPSHADNQHLLAAKCSSSRKSHRKSSIERKEDRNREQSSRFVANYNSNQDDCDIDSYRQSQIHFELPSKQTLRKKPQPEFGDGGQSEEKDCGKPPNLYAKASKNLKSVTHYGALTRKGRAKKDLRDPNNDEEFKE